MQNTNSNFSELESSLSKITYLGYDYNFIYGWLVGYVSYINDEEEDELLPTGLMFNEDKLEKNEAELAKIINATVKEYDILANKFYEKNEKIDISELVAHDDKINLLKFLYGYLSKMLLNDLDFESDDLNKIVDEEYYPALFIVVSSFITLSKQTKLNNCSSYFMDDIYTLVNELKSMWEAENNEDMSQYFESYQIEIQNINHSINSLFGIMRKIDEIKHKPND